MEVDEETVIHIHDGRCWLPARVSTQIADYIAEGFVFVCVLIFSICLHSGNIEVGLWTDLIKTLLDVGVGDGQVHEGGASQPLLQR